MSNTATALAQTEHAVEVVLREYASDSIPISKKLRILQLLEGNTKAACFLSMAKELRGRCWIFNSGGRFESSLLLPDM